MPGIFVELITRCGCTKRMVVEGTRPPQEIKVPMVKDRNFWSFSASVIPAHYVRIFEYYRPVGDYHEYLEREE